MKTFIASLLSAKGRALVWVIVACLLITAASLVTPPASAGGAADKAKKAFADWKAAQEGVAAAQAKLADAQRALQNAMAAVAKSGGKPNADQAAALAAGRAAVARAEEALRLAEKQELAARVALEAAIAELPDGELKDQLKRERNFPSLVAANGLYTVKFDAPSGQLKVSLPDDIRAGDTISGTVIAEPKGSTEEERNANRGVLNGYVVEIAGEKFPVNKASVGPIVIRRLQRPPDTGMPFPQDSFFDVFFAVDINSTPLRRERIPLSQSGAAITPDPKIAQTTIPKGVITGTPDAYFPTTFNIPPLGQTGRPIVITGPFDGNSSNTTINALAPRTLIQDFEKNTENVSGGFGLLAESPRKAVFKSPEKVSGPIQITVKEGDQQTTGTYRNVGVNLTAPKTKLLKGESTTLKIEVSGLQGITEPVPLHLVKGGVVTMQGGDVQSMTIKPEEVQSNGTFSTTRGITGLEAGGWNATATVVVFDTCLQDDNSGDLVVYSSATGDFIFCQGRGNLAGANPISLSTLNFGTADFASGVRVSAGDVNGSGGSKTGPVSIGPGASLYKNGAVTVADFNYKSGYLHVQIDGYNHTGNASGFVYQQITEPGNVSPKKINFTITDRDTRNNTCSCR